MIRSAKSGKIYPEPLNYKLATFANKLIIHCRSKDFLGSIQHIKETYKKLPADVLEIFLATENEFCNQLDDAKRKKYYEEFCKETSGFGGAGLLDLPKSVCLIKKVLGLHIREADLLAIMQEKVDERVAETTHVGSTQLIDFDLYVFLICSILSNQKFKSVFNRESPNDLLSTWDRYLPINPDSSRKRVCSAIHLFRFLLMITHVKMRARCPRYHDHSSFPQAWDSMCMMILLYCSFAVPYTIAFVGAPAGGGLSSLDILDIAIDAVFAVDITLNFLTARIGRQGGLVTDPRGIAALYARSWLLPDFASTVPFDLIVSAYLGSGTGKLGAIRLIRMIRLIRVLKFLSHLNRLKDREGLESFGTILGILNAAFLLFFTAHLLGCSFAVLALFEPDENWMSHYNPELPEADNTVQYGDHLL